MTKILSLKLQGVDGKMTEEESIIEEDNHNLFKERWCYDQVR